MVKELSKLNHLILKKSLNLEKKLRKMKRKMIRKIRMEKALKVKVKKKRKIHLIMTKEERDSTLSSN